MYIYSDFKNFSNEYNAILKNLEDFKEELKKYIKIKNINQVFNDPIADKSLFSIIGYDYGAFVTPYIYKKTIYGEVVFRPIYRDGSIGEGLRKLYISGNGNIFFTFNVSGPSWTDIDVSDISSSSSSNDGASISNQILMPIAEDLFKLFSIDDD